MNIYLFTNKNDIGGVKTYTNLITNNKHINYDIKIINCNNITDIKKTNNNTIIFQDYIQLIKYILYIKLFVNQVILVLHSVSVNKNNLYVNLKKLLLNLTVNKIIFVSRLTARNTVNNNCRSFLLYTPVKKIYSIKSNIEKLDKFTFGIFCRITPDRNVLKFTYAFLLFAKNNQHFNLLIAGECLNKDYLNKIKSIEEQHKNVTYIGFQDKSIFFKNIDVLIQPIGKKLESFGLSIIESIQYYVPVIFREEIGVCEVLPKNLGFRYNDTTFKEIIKAFKISSNFEKYKAQKAILHNYVYKYECEKKWGKSLTDIIEA